MCTVQGTKLVTATLFPKLVYLANIRTLVHYHMTEGVQHIAFKAAFPSLVHLTMFVTLETWHVVETVHLYNHWSPVRLSPTVGKCYKSETNHPCPKNATVVSLTTLSSALVIRYVSYILVYPSMNVCLINHSWEQYENYSLGVLYCEQLPAYLSNTQVLGTQL